MFSITVANIFTAMVAYFCHFNPVVSTVFHFSNFLQGVHSLNSSVFAGVSLIFWELTYKYFRKRYFKAIWGVFRQYILVVLKDLFRWGCCIQGFTQSTPRAYKSFYLNELWVVLALLKEVRHISSPSNNERKRNRLTFNMFEQIDIIGIFNCPGSANKL